MGRVTRQAEEFLHQEGALAVWTSHPHRGIQRDQGDGNVGGVSGDAVIARPKDGMPGVETIDRRAARPGIAFVTGRVVHPEIWAAHPLQQIAAD